MQRVNRGAILLGLLALLLLPVTPPLLAQGSSTTITSAGSGIVLTQDGYILTNAHVIAKAEGITVYVDGGRSYPATVVAVVEASDLALLKISASGLTPVALGNSLGVQPLDDVIAVGYLLPEYGRDLSVSQGRIISIRTGVKGREGKDTLQHDALIYHGSSGGPLLNMRGEVIGVNFGGVGGAGVQFAIPINEAVPILRNVPGFSPASMGRATTTMTAQEVVSRYRTSVVYIEVAVKFAWQDFLPDPKAIPGFPDQEVIDDTGLADSFKGLGFPVIGWAGLHGTSGAFLNFISVVAFSTSEAAGRASRIWMASWPTSMRGEHWSIVLGEGPTSAGGVAAKYKLTVWSGWEEGDCLLPSRYSYSCVARFSGRVCVVVGNMLLTIDLYWAVFAGLESSSYRKEAHTCWTHWVYRDGHLVERTFAGSERRLISGAEFARKLQHLADLVVTVALNKLSQR